jgi:hypothetical protein
MEAAVMDARVTLTPTADLAARGKVPGLHGTIRHFCSGERTGDSAGRGQDPRGASTTVIVRSS